MKLRKGFVSNSSSSSFMIATKGELTKEMFMEWMNTGKDSMFRGLAEGVASYLATCEKDIIGDFGELIKWWNDYHYGSGYEEEEDFKKQLELIRDGWTLYLGSVTDECPDSQEEWWLVGQEIHYKGYNLIIEKEAWY